MIFPLMAATGQPGAFERPTVFTRRDSIKPKSAFMFEKNEKHVLINYYIFISYKQKNYWVVAEKLGIRCSLIQNLSCRQHFLSDAMDTFSN